MSQIGAYNPNQFYPAPGPNQTSGDTTTTGTGTGTGTVNSTNQTQAPVGSGTVSQTGSIPDPQTVSTAMQSVVLMAVFESIAKFIPEISGDEQDILLAEIQAKAKEMTSKTDNEEVKNKSEAREKQLEERKKKLDDAEKKLEETIKLQASGDIFAKLQLFFEILAAVIAAVVIAVGTLGTGTGLSAAVLAGCITAIACGAVLAVNDITKMATGGLGIAGSIDKLVHPNDPGSWSKADMGFEFAVMALDVVGMVVGMANGSGESMIASTIEKLATKLAAKFAGESGDLAKLAMKVADEGVDVAKMTKEATTLDRITKYIQAGSDVASAAGDLGAGINSFETTEVQAQTKKDQARAKELLAMMKHLDEMIDLAIKRLQTDGARWVKMLDTVIDSMVDRANTVGKMSLTG